jgi:hypothetical protein
MKRQILQATKEKRDIEVEVTDKLKPSPHCSNAARTAQNCSGQLSRAFHYRDRLYLSDYTSNMLSHTWRHHHRPGLHGLRLTERYWKRYKNEQ